jgi:Uncharacterized protein conserved in bacteria (DUF2330)
MNVVPMRAVFPMSCLLWIASGFPARGACCYFSAQNNDVLQPAQKAFISWDEDTGMETFTVQPKFEGSVKDFGMVIPTPSRPKLDEMPRDFFKSLAVFTILEPVDWEKFSKPSARAALSPPPPATEESSRFLSRRASTVTVVEAGVVGTLDYKIITAERADDLYTWLKENEYSYAGDEATLDFYVKRNWFFTVMKIDTKQIRQGVFRKKFTGELTPTRFSFKSPEIVYPLRITERSVKDKTEALLYIQAPYKVDMAGTASYQDSWQWMWRQAFDLADPKKMTGAEQDWYAFTDGRTDPCFERVKKLQGAGLENATLEWARRLTPNDIRVLSGAAKFSREAPAADIAAMNCLRGHLRSGHYVTKIRKVFTKAEMTGDIVFRPASFGGQRDTMEYTAALPSSPP